jgi:hypothetical protein
VSKQNKPPVESNSKHQASANANAQAAALRMRSAARASALNTVHGQMTAQKNAFGQNRELTQDERIVLGGVDLVNSLENNMDPMAIVDMITPHLESVQATQAQDPTQDLTGAGPKIQQLEQTNGVQGGRRPGSITLPSGVRYEPYLHDSARGT